jgi:hypothetical protein
MTITRFARLIKNDIAADGLAEAPKLDFTIVYVHWYRKCTLYLRGPETLKEPYPSYWQEFPYDSHSCFY